MNDQDRYIDDAHLISTAIDLQDCLVIGCLLDYGHPGLHVYDALGHAGHCMEREVGHVCRTAIDRAGVEYEPDCERCRAAARQEVGG